MSKEGTPSFICAQKIYRIHDIVAFKIEIWMCQQEISIVKIRCVFPSHFEFHDAQILHNSETEFSTMTSIQWEQNKSTFPFVRTWTSKYLTATQKCRHFHTTFSFSPFVVVFVELWRHFKIFGESLNGVFFFFSGAQSVSMNTNTLALTIVCLLTSNPTTVHSMTLHLQVRFSFSLKFIIFLNRTSDTLSFSFNSHVQNVSRWLLKKILLPNKMNEKIYILLCEIFHYFNAMYACAHG